MINFIVMLSNIIPYKFQFHATNIKSKNINPKSGETHNQPNNSTYKYNFEDLKDSEKNKKIITNSFFLNYQRLESIEKYKKLGYHFFINENNVNIKSFITFLTISIILYSSSKNYFKYVSFK
jgi:hypothetical protein